MIDMCQVHDYMTETFDAMKKESFKQTIQWPNAKGPKKNIKYSTKPLHRKLEIDQHEPHKKPGIYNHA
jgi:hypothetical protein